MSIDLDRITHPLQLAAGSHSEGSGRGCAMNVISWIMGEPKISDFPACSDRMLASMVQMANDRIASIPLNKVTLHNGAGIAAGTVVEAWLLTPEDSIRALDLAWMTVGTAGQPIEVVAVWMKRMVAEAQRRFRDDGRSAASIVDAQRLLNLGKPEDAVAYLADAAFIYGKPYLAEFVGYAIRVFRDIAGLDEAADADPAVVNQAIERMVTV